MSLLVSELPAIFEKILKKTSDPNNELKNLFIYIRSITMTEKETMRCLNILSYVLSDGLDFLLNDTRELLVGYLFNSIHKNETEFITTERTRLFCLMFHSIKFSKFIFANYRDNLFPYLENIWQNYLIREQIIKIYSLIITNTSFFFEIEYHPQILPRIIESMGVYRNNYEVYNTLIMISKQKNGLEILKNHLRLICQRIFLTKNGLEFEKIRQILMNFDEEILRENVINSLEFLRNNGFTINISRVSSLYMENVYLKSMPLVDMIEILIQMKNMEGLLQNIMDESHLAEKSKLIENWIHLLLHKK